MCKGDAAAEFADGVTRRLSLPTRATRQIPPVPLPRRSPSTAQEWESVNNSQNLASCAAAPGLFIRQGIVAGVNGKSCEDSSSVCSAADLTVHEKNSLQVSNVDSSAADGSISTDCKQVVDITAAADGTAIHTVSHSALPVKPVRFKRQVQKELRESKSGLDVDSVSSMTVISVSEGESGGDSDRSPVLRRRERLFPQPRPRSSLLPKSTSLQSDKIDRKHSQSELAVDHPETLKDFSCQNAKSNDIVSISAEGEVNKNDGQTFDNPKLHGHVYNSIGSAESGQNQLELENNVSPAEKKSRSFVPSRVAPPPPTDKNSNILVPARAAPPPPLPKPKIVIDSAGSFEIVKSASDGDCSKSAGISDTDSVSDSFHSLSVSELVSGTNDGTLQQHAENTEIALSNSPPPENDKLSSIDEARKVKRPIPAVRKTRERSSEILSYSDSDALRHDEKNVHSVAAAGRRRSESIIRSEGSSEVHLLSSGVTGNSSSQGSRRHLSDSSCMSSANTLSPMSCEMYPAETPPITPAAFGFDVNDDEARTVCGVSFSHVQLYAAVTFLMISLQTLPSYRISATDHSYRLIWQLKTSLFGIN